MQQFLRGLKFSHVMLELNCSRRVKMTIITFDATLTSIVIEFGDCKGFKTQLMMKVIVICLYLLYVYCLNNCYEFTG